MKQFVLIIMFVLVAIPMFIGNFGVVYE